MADFPNSNVAMATGLDSGIHIVMAPISYVGTGTALIINSKLTQSAAPDNAADTIPSALVVMARVIGLSITAVMPPYAIQLYDAKRTLSIDEMTEPKW